MADIVDDFDTLLAQSIKKRLPTQIQWVRIDKVDWEDKVCDAKGLHDGLEFYDVFLGLGSVNYQPKQGTKALIGLIENDSAKAFLIWAEELDTVEIKVGESELKISDGFLLRKQNENLQKLMLDLIKAIKRMKFTTNTGSTIKLINTPEFTALEPRIKNLLKED